MAVGKSIRNAVLKVKADPIDLRNEGSKLFQNGAQLFQIMILLIVYGSIRICPDMTETVRNCPHLPGLFRNGCGPGFFHIDQLICKSAIVDLSFVPRAVDEIEKIKLYQKI